MVNNSVFLNDVLQRQFESISPFNLVRKANKTLQYAMVLGQEPDSFIAEFDGRQSYRGSISGFNMWNYSLSKVCLLIYIVLINTSNYYILCFCKVFKSTSFN